MSEISKYPTAGCTANPPVAREILVTITDLASRADSLLSRLRGKLEGVMLQPRPCNTVCEATKEREYPPLFHEMRGQLYTISSSFEGIEEALSRTEL